MKGRARPITPELVRAALASVPPNVDRETWVRVAMAVKAEMGADGFELWKQWSEAADSFNAADARATWRSIKAVGRVTIATLFGIAKQHGFRLDDAAPQTSAVDRKSVV